MKVGAISETVQVMADANLVETRSLAVGTLVTQDQLVGLPLNGRDATQLSAAGGRRGDAVTSLQPVTGAGRRDLDLRRREARATARCISWTAAYNNDPQLNTGNPIPFPDALQEFRTETGVRDARSGLSAGATVNAVTKSGTNAFHGNAFEFMRDHRFNAIRYFERTENGGLGRDDGLKRHQFGGTFGGPVMRDQAVLLLRRSGDQQLQRAAQQRLHGANGGGAEGRLHARSWGRAAGPAPRNLGAPFVDNKVDPALYHPISMKMMAMLPVADPATDPNGCGNYPFRSPNDRQDQQYVDARRLPVDAEQAGVLPRLHRQLEEAVALERGQAEPARADRRRTGASKATLT